jgi:drug/metabolite transporter (DMT)-like permease
MITLILTCFTLAAFAGNSLLCRMALDGGLIDPVSFTSLRLVSGAVALLLLSRLPGDAGRRQRPGGSWSSGTALFIYAMAFSLAYVSLTTGMGALILFASVQVTMIGVALKSGERLTPVQWLGFSVAVAGLIFLLRPGTTAPEPISALLMCLAGIAWGVYTIHGRGASSPINMTAGNFTRSVPVTLLASLLGLSMLQLEVAGVILAILSGVVTSGLGYALWYKILPGLTTMQASVVQLMVPVLAAFGGIVLLGEQLTLRLAGASILILGGVATVALRPKTATGPIRRAR